MKREISPATAVVVIVVVLVVVVAAFWLFTERRSGGAAEVPSVPPDVQAEFQRRMGGMAPTSPPATAPGR